MCQKPGEDLVGGFHDVARWCWPLPSADARTAVAYAFYEHFPENPVLRRGMPRRWGCVASTELRDVSRYHLSPEEDAAFEREFLEPEQRFVRRGAMDPNRTPLERMGSRSVRISIVQTRCSHPLRSP